MEERRDNGVLPRARGAFDTEEINENHNLIAALAGARRGPERSSPNFDRLLERASTRRPSRTALS